MLLNSLKIRQRQQEFMDAPGADPNLLTRSLGFIRKVNSLFGYTRATLSHLKQFSQHWKPGDQITILDVATGSADIPLAIVRWGNSNRLNIRVVGLDRHPITAHAASEQVVPFGGQVKIIRGDALNLPFDHSSFDYVMTNMFLHHLDEQEVVRALREMDRVARRGIIVADLLRNRRAYTWISLFTLLADPMVKHDARVSVAQAFTESEIEELCHRASIRYARYSPHFAHRFVLAGEKSA